MISEAITQAQSDHVGILFLVGLTLGLSLGYAWAIRHARRLRRRAIKGNNRQPTERDHNEVHRP
jgi:hypothetical protein